MSISLIAGTVDRNAHRRPQDCVPSIPLIDYEHLQRYTFGDRRMENEILQLFGKQLPQQLQQLRCAAEQKNASAWLEVTHALKGAAQAVGATVLAQRAAEAEQAADNCGQFDMSELAAAIAIFTNYIARIAETEVVK